ncbi:MAG TPA: hypothetical protein DDZ41_05285, partial [Flavobacterium sp.]|nr:hypothetical protein [Flavobacterium sp.]
SIQLEPDLDDAFINILIKMCYEEQNNDELQWEWFKKVTELGQPKILCKLAEYHYDIDDARTQNIVFDCFKKAAELGNTTAQYKLAYCYLYGIGTKKDSEQGLALFNKLAEQNINFYRFEAPEQIIEDYYLENKEPENLEQGLQWFKTKAEQGDNFACYLLAKVYFKSIKVKKNPILALQWLEKTSLDKISINDLLVGLDKTNINNLLVELAYYFETNNTESISSEKIIELYTKAALAGNANACIRLADYYRLGQYVEKNDALAFELYEAAYEMARIDLIIPYREGSDEYKREISIDVNHSIFGDKAELDDELPEYKKNWIPKYPIIEQLAALQLAHYYQEGKIVEQNIELAEQYQQLIDDEIMNPRYSASFPYKSFDEYEDSEKVEYLIFKGFIEPAREIMVEDWDVGHYCQYPKLKMKVREQTKELMKLNRELEKKNKQLELEIQEKQEALEREKTLHKQLQSKEKELEDMMSMFAHKFRSPLDAIIYNTSHENNPKLYIEAAQTMRGLLDIFSIISTDDKILTEKIKTDNQGNGRLMSVLNKTLDMILLHLLSKAGTEKIQQHYLRYAKAQGKVSESVTAKEWYNNYFELECALQNEWEQSFSQLLKQSASLEQRLNWIEEHFFKLEIIGFKRDDIQFKEYSITESFLTILLNEILVNVFKYYYSKTHQPVILEWSERDGNQVLICCNPSTRRERTTIKGSGKGHTFLSALARKIGSQFTKPKPQDDFVLEFSIPNKLLLS